MADDRNKRGRQDRAKVSLIEAHEIRFWSKKFGCTQLALTEAVAAVGHGARAVKAYLEARK